MKEEIEEAPLLSKIREIKEEIMSLKERRPPPTDRDTQDHQHNY